MPEKIAGLPAHPLIIHLPLVLGPVVGLLTLLLLAPKLRDRLLAPTAALSVVFAASAIAAVMSGENFLATLNLGAAIEEHEEAAETLRLLSVLLAATLVAFALGQSRLPKAAGTGLTLVVAILGVATVGFTLKTGHEGATLVWKQRFDAAEQLQNGTGPAVEERAGSSAAKPAGSVEDRGMAPEVR